MRQGDFVELIDETVALLLDVADEYLSEITAQLENVGSPEAVMGKPYEQFTPQDFKILTQIYGEGEPNPLSNLIFRKKYKEVLELEAEEA